LADTILERHLPHLRELRRTLHRYPELSGEEFATARRILAYLAQFQPDEVHEGLGGTGLAVVFNGVCKGPTVLLRAELDALPIQEVNTFEHASRHAGVSHKCGHDGHATSLCALAPLLRAEPVKSGRVVLLFQPAEETGAGAQAVLNDPGFAAIAPDWAFSLHNLPGIPLGQVRVKSGPFNCASRGMSIYLKGKTAHAAHPDQGRSPATAMCQLVKGLPELGLSQRPIQMATVVGARLGQGAFGTAPGDAVVQVTLRAETDALMAQMVREAEELVLRVATAEGLTWYCEYADVFHACANHPDAVAVIQQATKALTIPLEILDEPLRWSEDFGRLGATCKGAMFALGAGQMVPDLHNPDYDFPEELIQIAARIFHRCLCYVTGGDHV